MRVKNSETELAVRMGGLMNNDRVEFNLKSERGNAKRNFFLRLGIFLSCLLMFGILIF